MKTNLLLLDSYKNIEDLIAYAFSFSNRAKRDLKIIYVFDFDWMRQSYVIGSSGPVNTSLVAAEKNAREEFKVAEKKIREVAGEYIKKHAVKVSFEIDVSEINRIDVVQDEQKKNPAMMLLISNHQSYSEASGGVIGYPNLVEHVSCPVFVIPEGTKYSVMENVIYATSYHPEDLESLKHLTGLLENTADVHYTILHNQKDFDFVEKLKWVGFQKMAEEATGNEKFDFKLKTEKDMVSAIGAFTNEKDPDLLVMLKEKRGFFEELFSTSETKSVLTHFHKPVLVYHETSM